MGIFTKYKTFYVEFLVLVLFGWIIMESQMTSGKIYNEPFTDGFITKQHDLVKGTTYCFKMTPSVTGTITLIENPPKEKVSVKTSFVNYRISNKQRVRNYKTVCNIGTSPITTKEFSGILKDNLKIWVTIRENYIDIQTNHKPESTKDVETFGPIKQTVPRTKVPNETVINLGLNRNYLIDNL